MLIWRHLRKIKGNLRAKGAGRWEKIAVWKAEGIAGGEALIFCG
jgi:hypothetical protein